MTAPTGYWPLENPFATRAVRPGALAYLFPPGENVHALVDRLRGNHWRGEIVGPHGAGKSTLLAALIPELEAAGRRVVIGRLHEGEHRVPRALMEARPWNPQTLLVVDGYEQLGRCRQHALRWRCERAQCGLLVTAHAGTGLPLLAQLVPTREIVAQVVAALTVHCPTVLSTCDIDTAYAHHGENVRELLFELYDRYEARRRSGE